MAKPRKGTNVTELRAALRATLPFLNMMAVSDEDPIYQRLERQALNALGLKTNPTVRKLPRSKPISAFKTSVAKPRKFDNGQSQSEER